MSGAGAPGGAGGAGNHPESGTSGTPDGERGTFTNPPRNGIRTEKPGDSGTGTSAGAPPDLVCAETLDASQRNTVAVPIIARRRK